MTRRTGWLDDLAELLRDATPATRRAFLRRAAATGLALPAMIALAGAEGRPAEATTIADRAAGVRPRPAGRPKRGGVFTTMSHQDVTGLSADDAVQAGFRAATANILEGLLEVDENYRIVPRLAESYNVSGDGKTWTFRLRSGVTWHDGRPFTSADVKYSYEWVVDPANGAIGQPLFRGVDYVAAPDDLTVVVTLKAPDAPFAAVTATRLIVPKHYHEQVGEKVFRQQPIGTGPWKLREFNPQSLVVLDANDAYWGGRPWIDQWRQTVVPETAVRAISLRTGESDATTWPLAPEDTLRFLQDATFKTYRAPGAVINHFPLNNKLAIFQDRRVRRAMMHAIDREGLVRDLFKGLAAVATANLSPAIGEYYEPNVRQYPYDPQAARALLSEAGWRPGGDGVLVNGAGERFSVTCLVFTGDSLRRAEAEIVQQQFKDVGIEMKFREIETSAGVTAGRKGDYEMGIWNTYYGGNNGEPDARDGLMTGAVNNFPQWSNPDADRLLEQGATTTDPEQRKRIYSDLQKLVAEEVPFLYLMFWENAFQFNRRIKGMPETATNPAWLLNKVHTFWIEEE